MQIPDETLAQFIEIYGVEFGEMLTRQKAAELASDLLRLYERVSWKLPNELPTAQTTTQLDARGDDRPMIGFRT